MTARLDFDDMYIHDSVYSHYVHTVFISSCNIYIPVEPVVIELIQLIGAGLEKPLARYVGNAQDFLYPQNLPSALVGPRYCERDLLMERSSDFPVS